MFDLLVKGEGDAPGFVAYGLYKQNKRDWCAAHAQAHGRDPEPHEIETFILGESLPRRIATYRRLADDLLRSPVHSKSGKTAAIQAVPVDPIPARATPAAAWRTIAFLLVLLVAMAMVFRFAGNWLFQT